MASIKKVVKFEDLPDEAFEALEELYPDGWEDEVRRITKSNGEYFYAISIETENAFYLAKVNYDVDTHSVMDNLDDIIDRKEAKAAKAFVKNFDTDEETEDIEDDEAFEEED